MAKDGADEQPSIDQQRQAFMSTKSLDFKAVQRTQEQVKEPLDVKRSKSTPGGIAKQMQLERVNEFDVEEDQDDDYEQEEESNTANQVIQDTVQSSVRSNGTKNKVPSSTEKPRTRNAPNDRVDLKKSARQPSSNEYSKSDLKKSQEKSSRRTDREMNEEKALKLSVDYGSDNQIYQSKDQVKTNK